MKSKHLFSIFVCILLLIFLVSCSGAEAPGYGKGDYSGGVEAPGSGLEDEMPDSPGEDGSGSNPETWRLWTQFEAFFTIQYI